MNVCSANRTNENKINSFHNQEYSGEGSYVRRGGFPCYDPVVGGDSQSHGADGDGAKEQRHFGDCVCRTSHDATDV